jgi:methylase of polypeptide subunit release factors
VTIQALLDDADLDRLRAALQSADFTSDGIAERLGPDITAAVARNDFRKALQVTQTGDALDTLIRLYVCGQTEPEEAVQRAFKGVRDPSELLAKTDDGFRAGVDLEPYGDGEWILSDLPSSTLRKDHVLGVGGASTTLANAVIRKPVERALDLGTGCGIQALHLSRHANHVTATDISTRALRFAKTTAMLAQRDWDLREGDLVEPVQDERFDLIVSNPPFVVGPGTTTHTYRDSGRPGDAVSMEVARSAARILNPGGTLQFLANWLHVTGEDWAERVAGWFSGTGLDVWVIQREVSDPMAYVDLWLNDAFEAGDPQRAAQWLDWFDAHKVEAVGFGIVNAKLNDHVNPVVRVETLRQPLAHPFGPQVEAWFDRQAWLRDETDLLDRRFRTADGLELHQEAARRDGDWDVTRQVLTQTDGLGWSEEVDPALLAIVSGCDGTSTMRDQLDILALAWDESPATLYAIGAIALPRLIERGFLTPCEP